jgi:hypothetical protein
LYDLTKALVAFVGPQYSGSLGKLKKLLSPSHLKTNDKRGIQKQSETLNDGIRKGENKLSHLSFSTHASAPITEQITSS